MTERYTPTEEIANGVTHGVGLGASLAGAALLIVLTALHGDGWQIASSVVYGAALVTLYTASTLYHSLRGARVKRALRVFDHCSIYLLIAGSYTPFALVSLRGTLGWTLFGLVWGLAVAGIVFKVFFTGRLNALSTGVYVLMG
ncbi:MAG: hemolysin III family protein [Rubrobacteraceae bacterium]